MKYNKHIGLALLGGLLGIAGFSCTDKDLEGYGSSAPEVMVPVKLRAYVTFADYENSKTRFTTEANDGWSIGGSVNYFTDGDTVGIFARAGNFNLPTTNGKGGPLINIPMYFEAQEYLTDPSKPYDEKDNPYTTQYVLLNDTVEVMPSLMQAQEVYMYYPYSKDMGTLENYPGWKNYVNTQSFANGSIYYGSGYTNSPYNNQTYPDILGLPIRIKAPDGSIRCRDVANMYAASASDLTKGKITGTVRHSFSSLQITRGEGFENPMRKDANGDLIPDETIYVVLDKPVTHLMVISYSDGVRWTTKPFYDETYSIDGQSFSEEEARKWEAWEGAKFAPSTTTPEEDKQRAWYVIIPTIYHENSTASWNGNSSPIYDRQYSARPTVTEIQMYDNDGYLQHVTSFTLKTSAGATATKKPYPYYRWHVEVAMDEFGSTVRPVAIVDWDEEGDDKDLTEERTAGIHSVQDYNDWVRDYNSYILAGRTDAAAEPLKVYGDLVDGKYWNFYVSEFEITSATVLNTVDELQDQLVGDNNFFNVTFNNLRLTQPLFKKVSYYGGITNIDFRNPYLEYTTNDTTPVGIIAGEIDSADGSDERVIFQNCNIYNGTVISQGPVGLFAGSTTYGNYYDCEFSGFIMGSSTSTTYFPRVFAVAPTLSPDVVQCNYNNIIFSNN